MKGQSLIEVIVALVVVSSIVIAVSSLAVSTLGGTNFVKAQTTASQYAQEGMEVVRQIKDADYSLFLLYLIGAKTVYCMDNTNTLIISDGDSCTVPNINDIFIRQIIFEQDDDKCGVGSVKITSDVSWTDSTCDNTNPYCHNVRLSSCFTNFTAVPTP